MSRHQRIDAYGVGFGLEFDSQLASAAAGQDWDVEVRTAAQDALLDRWSGAAGPPLWETTFADQADYRVEIGTGGDYLFTYSDRATFHLSSQLDQLTCAPAEVSDAHWQRVLLDDVFHGVSAVRGHALLHCSAVNAGAGVLAFAGPTGAGKTSLAFEMLRRGAELVCDDILAVTSDDRTLLGHPAPRVMNLPRVMFEAHSSPPSLSLLATFPEGDEVWVRLAGDGPPPAPIGALFLLEGHTGARTELERLDATVLDLAPFGIGFRHDSAHSAARFETFGDLAEDAAVYRLRLGRKGGPAGAADAVCSAVVPAHGRLSA